MALPRALDSARLVPGRVTALITSAPSLNAGRNARPRNGVEAAAATDSAPAATSTVRGWRRAWGSSRI